MSMSINVAFLLAVVIVLRVRGHALTGGRSGDLLMAAVVLLFVVLVVPTDLGQWVVDFVSAVVSGLTGAVVDLLTP
ncbi:hypothetical protein AB0I84_42015 [Streptomyces spectabilis]|uniref:Uncharacterized protein n=1 Tax=Streptomyces spectabilis TaxID=68270 RepID=A0A516RH15_STRST|nr:hypothetical protein [Streptomyces spectabilis]MBB5105351.1 hypothetical protein [Streptomyces spectabilis]MCI3906544.1 hypothetical protein [Streptomyces spectabilis]QDQ14943.1 hypothetical protein FH965_33980 [Streptomyces spectabilis]QEV63374.1 hypothetical protein CP982_35600 [Streptomyces spectabilis]GGV21099.1 hypothetical protein GCM10010245_35480 [Streptomyces spectabilis]